MHLLDPQRHSRRAFLRRSGQLALAGSALPLAINLAAIGEAAAMNASGYKALVCVFLYGGNDYANTVVTYDEDSYDRYSAIRGGAGHAGGGLALARSALAATLLQPAAALPGGRQYALNPAMAGLAGLFNSGQAAVQLNVGPLVKPVTRAQYHSADRRAFPLPPKLFSHNDQQSIWQSSSPEGSTIGWGGNLGDLALGSNAHALFTCISVTGNAVFLAGDQALQYQVSPQGAVPIQAVKQNWFGDSVRNAVNTLVTQARQDMLENEYNRVTARSIGAEAQISSALGDVSLATPFPAGNTLADQMKMVARLIGARSALGARRQVFLVSLGGFDNHDELMVLHPPLVEKLSAAMTAFYHATVELGVADQVTAFTASDFGRTLSANSGGSDHGWGSHHFVVGGAVKGKAFYGTAPPVSVGDSAAPEDQWHVGQGRLLPSTSMDQYAATLAKWFGVDDAELPGVLPNVGHFGATAGRADYPVNLGFL